MHQNKHLLFFTHCSQYHVEYPKKEEHLMGRHIHEKFALNPQTDFIKEPSSRGGDTAQLSKQDWVSFASFSFHAVPGWIHLPVQVSCSQHCVSDLNLQLKEGLLSFPFTCRAEEQWSLQLA